MYCVFSAAVSGGWVVSFLVLRYFWMVFLMFRFTESLLFEFSIKGLKFVVFFFFLGLKLVVSL